MTEKALPWYRRLRPGRKLLWLRHKAHLGLWKSIVLGRSKQSNLRLIRNVEPAPAGDSNLEVHMLLGHSRIEEGLWSLLSFAHMAGEPVKVVIHDDGTLTQADRDLLKSKIPQLRIVTKPEADAALSQIFERDRLPMCKSFRDAFVLARKVFDPPVFAEERDYLLLDSDVVFFRRPSEMLERATNRSGERPPLFSTDNGFRYSFSSEKLAKLIGTAPLARVNSGMLRLTRDTVNFARVERYLADPGFWEGDGKANYYAEMTILALELTNGAGIPLSDGYAIAPNPHDPSVIAGHYCGGIRSAYTYYVEALPIVGDLLGRIGNASDSSRRSS